MKKKAGKVILTVLIIIFTAVFLFSAYKLISIITEYKAGENTYEEVTENVVVEKAPSKKPGKVEEVEKETVPIEVDFTSLCAQYEDVIGWIYSPDTVINYPVVQGEDNDYYLNRLITGEYNGSGTIFIDMYNSPDITDTNTIMYGHHMKNGSMFRSLVEYRDTEGYYEEHPVMYFLTPDANYRVDIFAGFTTSATSDTYTFNFSNEDEFMTYIADAVNNSDFETDVEVLPTDRIVTLSTCTYWYDNARYVIQGKLTEIPD